MGFNSQVGIIDTSGDLRWYLLNGIINDPADPWTSGFMMGFQQTNDGALTWGFGQRYVKYDLMGREIFNRRLPEVIRTIHTPSTMLRMDTASCV